MKRERKERGQSVPLPLRATLLKLLRLPSFRSLRGAIIRAFSAPMVCRQDKGSEYWPINTGRLSAEDDPRPPDEEAYHAAVFKPLVVRG